MGNERNILKMQQIRFFLERDALHTTAGFSLGTNNYKEAFQFLQNRYGNTQPIIAAQMNVLVKTSSVDNEDLLLRKFFGDDTSHLKSLVNLGVGSRTHGSLLCSIRLENLPNERRLR